MWAEKSQRLCTMEAITAAGREAEVLGRLRRMMDSSMDWLASWGRKFKWRAGGELGLLAGLGA